ncbi:SRPBCC family protein [Curtobacterium sp. PhB78]|uniref:SRPBCC family protein n=1 Tax=Curtobacterium sp. PhB78 TaxID=2485102 RepID=UPI000F4921E7|nr:SRPBCC family protein [Curtobacterium sp. PhB78]ROS47398.1 polyketide cyclase/dehydrase/lipid transport protein [Curtobacterium sp. PhB78]
MTVTFRVVTELAAPPERAFALSLDIGAHERSMAATDERAVAGTTSGTIGLGESVTWRARHFGIVWRMTSRITALEAPHRFVDEQVRGPFARFHHEHRFEPSAGGTRMVDTITFRAPFGPLGRLAEVVALERYLPRLIRERNASLATELHADGRDGPDGPDGQGAASSPSAS